MKNLQNITLISIADSEYLDKTVKAIKYCIKKIKFHDVKIVTNNVESNLLFQDMEKIEIPHKLCAEKYSEFCIKNLNDHINSDFCLIIQWDGFIINEEMWSDTFFDYDYIGAPWGFPEDCKNRVGNGGFSLRSKKFLKVSSTIEYDPYNYEVYTELQKIDKPIAPEDWFLCFHSYEKMVSNKIKFADINTAYSFSVEHPSVHRFYDRQNIKTYNSFGFHGAFNVAAMKLLEN